MPSKKERINLTLPDDLRELVTKDSSSLRIGAATRVMQILDEHYKRAAAEMQRSYKVLKGSELLKERQDLTMDFSGGLLEEQARPDEPSKDAGGAGA